MRSDRQPQLLPSLSTLNLCHRCGVRPGRTPHLLPGSRKNNTGLKLIWRNRREGMRLCPLSRPVPGPSRWTASPPLRFCPRLCVASAGAKVEEPTELPASGDQQIKSRKKVLDNESIKALAWKQASEFFIQMQLLNYFFPKQNIFIWLLNNIFTPSLFFLFCFWPPYGC